MMPSWRTSSNNTGSERRNCIKTEHAFRPKNAGDEPSSPIIDRNIGNGDILSFRALLLALLLAARGG
jgi:hypothetical protein